MSRAWLGGRLDLVACWTAAAACNNAQCEDRGCCGWGGVGMEVCPFCQSIPKYGVETTPSIRPRSLSKRGYLALSGSSLARLGSLRSLAGVGK